MLNVLEFEGMKRELRKIRLVTCYDSWSAKIVDQSDVDCVLVGDSCAMVMHGFPSTVHATLEMMTLHTAAVSRSMRTKFLIADMPFLSFRKGEQAALDAAGDLVRAGAHAVKLEGVWGHESAVEKIVGSGIPVMGHIGLTPQSIHGFGGFRVQGREEETARDLVAQAKKLEELGVFSLVLECVPSALAEEITKLLKIPTIGIGASSATDGQVLVLQDLLGMNSGFKPKFLRQFMNGEQSLKEALDAYGKAVREGTFPLEKESYA
jgi:3-methyl-2-oxobutanoate hydroxymethyltransferase